MRKSIGIRYHHATTRQIQNTFEPVSLVAIVPVM